MWSQYVKKKKREKRSSQSCDEVFVKRHLEQNGCFKLSIFNKFSFFFQFKPQC